MPVKKIRDLQEMEDSLWYEPGDPELWRAIKAVEFRGTDLSAAFSPGSL